LELIGIKLSLTAIQTSNLELFYHSIKTKLLQKIQSKL
jgi:hypothetical protein